MCHVENKITDKQHGFIGGKSCLSNLLETVDIILELQAEDIPVDILYFDFCKAFDTVPHYRLLTKLENYGLSTEIIDIVRDFLSDRTMRVAVGGMHSSTKIVTSGVPQGSVLGPLLFVLYINDLPVGINNRLKLFADDLKIIANADNYSEIKK